MDSITICTVGDIEHKRDVISNNMCVYGDRMNIDDFSGTRHGSESDTKAEYTIAHFRVIRLQIVPIWLDFLIEIRLKGTAASLITTAFKIPLPSNWKKRR